MLVEITHIRRAFQEPEQLVDDRLHVQLLGGDERKALLQIEAHLVAEQSERAGPGAVRLSASALAHAGEEIEILAQRGGFSYDRRGTGPPRPRSSCRSRASADSPTKRCFQCVPSPLSSPSVLRLPLPPWPSP